MKEKKNYQGEAFKSNRPAQRYAECGFEEARVGKRKPPCACLIFRRESLSYDTDCNEHTLLFRTGPFERPSGDFILPLIFFDTGLAWREFSRLFVSTLEIELATKHEQQNRLNLATAAGVSREGTIPYQLVGGRLAWFQSREKKLHRFHPCT